MSKAIRIVPMKSALGEKAWIIWLDGWAQGFIAKHNSAPCYDWLIAAGGRFREGATSTLKDAREQCLSFLDGGAA